MKLKIKSHARFDPDFLESMTGDDDDKLGRDLIEYLESQRGTRSKRLNEEIEKMIERLEEWRKAGCPLPPEGQS